MYRRTRVGLRVSLNRYIIAYPEDTGVWFYVPLKVSIYYGSNLLGTLVVGTKG